MSSKLRKQDICRQAVKPELLRTLLAKVWVTTKLGRCNCINIAIVNNQIGNLNFDLYTLNNI